MFARGRFAGWAVGIGLAVAWGISGAFGAWADTPAADSYDGGDGSASTPYQIATLAQLRRLSETSGDWGKHFILTADMDASDTATWNVGDHDSDGGTPDEAMGFSPIGNLGTNFTGSFDGDGHIIAGLFINRPVQDGVGLFGVVDSGASVSDVRLVDVDITGHDAVGGLVGSALGPVTSCGVTGAVTGGTYVGGLVGVVYGSATMCYAAAQVDGGAAVGGLAGMAGTINSCYATGAVSGTGYVGGLVGVAGGTITSCFATGAVSGVEGVGGLAGLGGWLGVGGTITSCYATGAVSGTDDVGGLVGLNETGSIGSSYWDTDTSGTGTGIGQDNAGTESPTGLTSAEMLQQAVFTGWDFATTWSIVEGETRPYLQWQTVALFEGAPSATTRSSFTIGEGYVHNVTGSGVNLTEYGFLVREDGDTPEMVHAVATGQSLAPGSAVALDGTVIPGLDSETTFRYRAYAIDENGLDHVGTERGVTTGRYTAGSGTPGDPYQIATLAELRALSETPSDWASHFMLTADIDASDTATWNVDDHDGDAGTPDEAMGFSPIGSIWTLFTGSLDGHGHTIAGLFINRPAQDRVGLFGYLGYGGSVSGLGLVQADITGSNYVGGLVARNDGDITSCYATGAVSGADTVGGLVGQSFNRITSCYATGTVTGSWNIGGLVGHNSDNISSCYATGAASGSARVGGLIGTNYGWVESCYATGAASGTNYIGGFAGANRMSIKWSYATGAASGSDSVGGLVGYSDFGSARFCYATGAVSGSSRVGGFAGWLSDSYVEGSFWDTETSGTTTGIGDNDGSGSATGLTSAEMQQQTTFAGWDLATTWGIEEGETRPYLPWQPVAVFEGVAEGTDGLTLDEGYAYNVAGSGIVVTEYGLALREAGSPAATHYPAATGQSLSEGTGVNLDGFTVEGLTEGATYHYQAYAVDDSGVTHYGTERTTTTTHRPTSADGAVTTDEDTAYVFDESDFAFSDVDAGDTFGGIRITTLATAGVVQYNAGSWEAVTQGQEVSVADITAGNLRFKPAANANGTPYATFEFQVADNTANYSVASYVMTVNVTPIPDVPVIDQEDPQTLTTEMNTPGTLELTVTEGDDDPLTWTFPTPPTNGTAEMADGELTYTPDPGYLGADWFVVEVSDGGDGSDSLTVLVTVIEPTGDPCDVDGNGVVNAIDVQLVINAALGLTVAYDCDANKDGSVNAIDVQLVINAALGL